MRVTTYTFLDRNKYYQSKLQTSWGIKDDSNLIFLLLNTNICCDPSLEPSQREGSNDGSENMFLLKNLHNYLLIIPVTPSYLQH